MNKLYSLPSLQTDMYQKHGMSITESIDCCKSLFEKELISDYMVDVELVTGGISPTFTYSPRGVMPNLSKNEARVLIAITSRRIEVATNV